MSNFLPCPNAVGSTIGYNRGSHSEEAEAARQLVLGELSEAAMHLAMLIVGLRSEPENDAARTALIHEFCAAQNRSAELLELFLQKRDGEVVQAPAATATAH